MQIKISHFLANHEHCNNMQILFLNNGLLSHLECVSFVEPINSEVEIYLGLLQAHGVYTVCRV